MRLPAKSISNRVLLLAGSAAGTTVLEPARLRRHPRHDRGAGRSAAASATARCSASTASAAGRRSQSATFFLGNAGTAMRPLPAALAVLAASSGELRASRRPAHARAADRRPGRRAARARLPGRVPGKAGYPPLRVRPKGPCRSRRRVRGDVSSQFLTALLLALPLRAGDDPVIDVDGELISKPYVDITLNLLARFGIASSARARAPIGLAAAPLRSPGSLPRRGGRVVGVMRPRRDRARCADRRRRPRLDPGRHPLRRRRAGDGRAGRLRPRLARGAPRRMAAEGDRARLQPHPRRRDDAGRDGPLRRRPDPPDQHRELARQGDRPHRRDGRGAAQVRREVEDGADFIEVAPPRVARRRDPHLRRPSHGDVLSLAAFNALAGARPAGWRANPRSALRRQDLPRLLRNPVRARTGASRRTVPVITIDGPTASGKGTLASAVAQALGYELLRLRARSTARRRSRSRAAGVDPRPARTRWRNWPRRSTCASRASTPSSTASTSASPCASRKSGNLASRVSAFPSVRQALHALQLAFRRRRASWPTAATWERSYSRKRRLKIFLTASVEERAARRHGQLISRGFPANIDSLTAELRARDARDQGRRRRTA